MRRYVVFATVASALLMYAIDSTVVAVAFPVFTRDLHTNVLWSAWTISIFFIAVTIAMPLSGKLSDSFGRKKVFLISLLLFTVSSLASGFAPNIYTLIAFRFLQGLGGASFLPTASGIVSDIFPENRQTAIGLFSSIYNVGAIIGPNLGGWIVSRYSWRYVFYLNLPIGLLLMLLITILVKDSGNLSRPRVDLKGASLMSGAILFFMFGLNSIGESFSSRSLMGAALLLIFSLCLGLLFLHHERKEADPFFDLALLQSRPFLAANAANLIVGAVSFGVFSFIPFYATSVHKLSTMMSGLILTPRSFGVIVASTTTSFLLKRLGYRRPMVLGFIIVSIATILLAPGLPLWGSARINLDSAELMAILLLFAGIGIGIVFPAVNNACIELMPHKVATIVGLRSTFRTMGGALGVSLITFIIHLSSSPARGFTIIFISFGLTLLCSIPLLFLMPSGKGEWEQPAPRLLD
jgi:EmrB/QacA subfamily drug resistance transporter